jgi:fatty-acyl-CoA synthase
MHIPSILLRAARLFPRHPAVLRDGEWEPYAAFAERVCRLAGGLKSMGVGPGDRVAALLPNDVPYLELYFAAPIAGAVLVPLNWRLSAGEISRVLEHAEATLLVADERFRERAEPASGAHGVRLVRVGSGPECEGPAWDDLAAGPALDLLSAPTGTGDEPAQLYYTSGTTGRPKGVVLTHRNVCSHALMAIAELSLTDADTWLHAAPMFHLADAWASFAVTWAGGRHVFTPEFEPDAVLDQLDRGGVTLTNLIPTMLNVLVRRPGAAERRYEALRLVLSGGAPISPELVRRVSGTFGCTYLQTYGLTETSPYLTVSRPTAPVSAMRGEERAWYAACTGRPLVGVDLRVVDEQGRDVPADRDTVGEIVVRGPSVTPGYWKDPEATSAAFEDGWFHTGDLAVLDREGYVDIVDRKKDVINTGGEVVYSVEVENVLLEHPLVVEAAVVAAPDERWGEAVKAVVVVAEGSAPSEEELVTHCRRRLAHFKAPRSVELWEALPRTGSNKIDKLAIRERYWVGRDRRVG